MILKSSKKRLPLEASFFCPFYHRSQGDGISFDMIYAEDVKKIFKQKAEFLGGTEIALLGPGSLVVSGHKGLLCLCSEEVTIRRKKGYLRVLGNGLSVLKASPSEIYVSGAIRTLEFSEAQD